MAPTLIEATAAIHPTRGRPSGRTGLADALARGLFRLVSMLDAGKVGELGPSSGAVASRPSEARKDEDLMVGKAGAREGDAWL